MNDFNSQSQVKKLKALVLICVMCFAKESFSADGFKTHFATTGTLGENIFTPNITPGGFVGLGYKKAVAEAVTDSSGNEIKKAPNGLPFSYKNTGSIQYIHAGYTAAENYAGGYLTGFTAIPFTSFDKTVMLAGTLSLPNSSANVNGLDDLEIGGTWDYKKSADTKYSVGLALTTKTGGYQIANNGASIGQGYYTLKPSFLSITQNGAVSYAYKATLGVNSKNNDANYRSGNILSLEAAVGYKTSLGALGLKVHQLQQIQNDSGSGVPATVFNIYNLPLNGVTAPNTDGNRIKYSTASVFFTTPVNAIGSIFYIGFTSMRNAFNAAFPNDGYYEIRLTKAFN